jgi:DNA-binding helix-hairpin-helix protein with protein kinase domain
MYSHLYRKNFEIDPAFPPISGGLGSFFRIKDNTELAFKKWHNPTPELTEHAKSTIHNNPQIERIAFPVDFVSVTPKSETIGVTVPVVPNAYEFVQVTNKFARKAIGLEMSELDLFHFALDVVKLHAAKVRHGFLQVDIRPENHMVQWNRISKPKPWIVDTEHFAHGKFSAKAINDRYKAPELKRDSKRKPEAKSEAYSVALIAFEILKDSSNPYNAIGLTQKEQDALAEKGQFVFDPSFKGTPRNVGIDWAEFHPVLQSYFITTFGKSVLEPSIRPTIDDLMKALKTHINTILYRIVKEPVEPVRIGREVLPPPPKSKLLKYTFFVWFVLVVLFSIGLFLKVQFWPRVESTQTSPSPTSTQPEPLK